MGSKGRIPPHTRRSHPGLGMVYSEPFASAIRPPPGGLPPFELLPPPEIMEQKLAAQHVEMERLAAENQRLATTHGTLRQQLAAAQQDLQMLQAQVGAAKSGREQQMRGLMDKISKMESELHAAEPIKLELQQAHAEAQSLVTARQELFTKVQQLTQDLQKAHADLQQVPALMAELDGLRQEYQHCRATYDYEKKLYNDHLESLQVMEKNYITMAREMEKLHAELNNSANVDRRSAYGGAAGYGDNDASGHHPLGTNAYEDGYAVLQGRGPPSSGPGGGAPTYGGPQSVMASARPGYDAQRGPSYDPQGGPVYNSQRGPSYDIQQRPPAYEAQRAAAAAGYDVPRGGSYDAQSRGAAPPSAPGSSSGMPYGSSTPPARAGGGYEATPRGGNSVRR